MARRRFSSNPKGRPAAENAPAPAAGLAARIAALESAARFLLSKLQGGHLSDNDYRRIAELTLELG